LERSGHKGKFFKVRKKRGLAVLHVMKQKAMELIFVELSPTKGEKKRRLASLNQVGADTHTVSKLGHGTQLCFAYFIVSQ